MPLLAGRLSLRWGNQPAVTEAGAAEDAATGTKRPGLAMPILR
jgi:hypothetical protein